MSLDALKALKDKLKKEKEQVAPAAGEKKYVRKAELEAAKLLKLRQEEEEERQRKELKRKQQETESQEAEGNAAKKRQTQQANEQLLPELSREEVIRRLRALGQPATLFGEEHVDRLRRLLKAEKEVAVEEETRGGQQDNVMLELQRQERQRAKQKALELAALKEAAEEAKREAAAALAAAKSAAAAAAAANDGKDQGDTQHRAAQGPAMAPQAAAGPGGGGEDGENAEEAATMEAFKKAAAALAEQRAEEGLVVEDRIAKWIKRWMAEWEQDLDKRPDAMKATAVGYQASMLFEQTKRYLEPLYERLKHRALHEELRAGLWMMVQAMRDRNYLYANDIYLRLAIGNAPWPIGVTSVGIHERSAREKISHVMNESGQAHIMNDEATRKYLQAVKRLIGAVQRMYPTLPSRSVDFESAVDPGRGVSGAGSTKLALLQAEQRGETVEALGLPAAPHFLEESGKVMVPPKWKNILSKFQESMPDPGRAGSPAPRPDSPAPPATKSQSPLPVRTKSPLPT